MSVDEVYKLMLFICSKNLQQGYLSPEDFNTTINQASKSYASYLLGSFQQYTPGRPVSTVELGQNSVVRQRLTPIIYGYNLPINQTTGFSAYPGDYLQTDSMMSIYGVRRIRYADQHKFVSIYNSVIDRIQDSPIYTLVNTGFNFFPSNPYNLTQAKLHYVREPPNAVWGYDLDANGLPVYNAAKSTQLLWDDASILEVVVRALAIIGVNLQFGVVLQYSNDIKQGGQ